MKDFNQQLEDYRKAGIIKGYGGPVTGPFFAENQDGLCLERETMKALALAVEAYWID
jgi:hypothetical protein